MWFKIFRPDEDYFYLQCDIIKKKKKKFTINYITDDPLLNY